VFINYRGADTHSYAALLYTELTSHFGDEQVFLDCESIPAGADFVQELLGQVRSARVLLAVIGPRWLTTTDPTGRRRIDHSDDWIRRELAEAFAAGVRVIPVLTDQAEMPTVAELPADIAGLSRCQYRRLRHHDPTADLARIVADLVGLDPVLAAAARSRDDAPRQLPAVPSLFTGRSAELAALTGAMTGATVVISAIGGAGGIGKTALALHWAHQHLHLFPDGQLYVDLRGFDPSGRPIPPGHAVRGFLLGLGGDPATLPVDLDAQAARYRSLVAGRKMLIVLDNARDIDQVTPLLPGSPTCTVVVTSRHQLAGLAALHGAHLLDLDVLPEPDARQLLACHVGPQRLAAEPAAAAELLAVCAGLPLAVAIVAARAAHHPTFPLAVLADELRDAPTRLAGLDAGDLRANLRTVLSWSVRTLGAQAADLFALLGIAPGPDISLPAAASLVALPIGQVRKLLRELENASLVQQHVPGRYRMHDLIRLYATDTADDELTEDVRTAALRRVLDFYIHTAHAADQLLSPHGESAQLDPPIPGVRSHPLPDAAAALAWFDTEHVCLLASHHTAAAHRWHSTVWHVAWVLRVFHFRRAHRHDQLTVWQTTAEAATHLDDPTVHTLAQHLLGAAYAELGRHDKAVDHLNQALALAEHHQDLVRKSQIHRALARAWELRGDDRLALDHAYRCLDLVRGLDQPVREAVALNMVGWHAAHLGDFDTARKYCQAALALHRHHNNPNGEADSLDSLGYVEDHSGHHQDALDHYREALTLYRNLGSTYQVPDNLDGLGHPHVALDQPEQARAAWQEALELYREQGRHDDAARVQRQLDALDP
jgi:hypothetical protein